ncbi:hypothetical protein [Paraburkholderia terrae]|uniref:Cell wall surface anchor family protein n=1 Tax=Paraburkholderia terrae TaxID=311230 RepID=A0ABM7TPC8_9BURK|nr:hypothetical protein [Paraburkholderia terrae]BCZ80865.1 hypothetical protein PTKU64_45400 [Paraburkholderia terrae]BDC40667.1 hypothetical protein PTKU15_39640 [Paraburkholderia terrae]
MADSAESTISRPARARSQNRRTSTVSPETENKLARAARSAQRLAQLSDAARDGSTLDLFPDDTARAEQQAMSIDVRQGTLQGFELPDVVLAAVGAPDGVGFAAGSAEGKAAVRGARGAAASKDLAAGAVPHDGQLVIDTEAGTLEPAVAEGQALAASVDGEVAPAATNPAQNAAPDAPTQPASLAAASVVRSVAVLRQISPPTDAANAAAAADTQSESSPAAGGLAQRSANPDSKTAPAAASEPSAHGASAAASNAQPTRPAPYIPPPQAHAPRATPELDHARATAFADTVDALYGVIADQRRAADDHTRRMKWMLTIVVCALLMTIAIGIAQTLLLFRLSHQSTAHEQRIEQMMLNQQATLATLLDTDSSTTSLPVSLQVPAAPATPAPVAPAATRPAETHVAHAQHAQKRKLAHTH